MSSVNPLAGITRVGVIGAGQMGRGIAQLAASHGFFVTLADAQRDIAERGRGLIGQQLAKLVDKEKLDAEAREQILASGSSRPTFTAASSKRSTS